MALVLTHPAIANAAQKGAKEEFPVGESSFIQHVAYDPQTFQMTVTLKNGGQYLYFMVYPNVYEQFTQSRSKGEFYSKIIKGQHQSTRTIDKNIGTKIPKETKKRRPHG